MQTGDEDNMENEIDIVSLGNRIRDVRMRKAYFTFCGELADYLHSCENDAFGDSFDMKDCAQGLVNNSLDFLAQIEEKKTFDEITSYPFDMGCDLVRITARWNNFFKLGEEKAPY